MASVSHSVVSTEAKPSRSNHPLQSSSYHLDNIFGDYTQLLWNMLFIVIDVIGGAVAVMSASTNVIYFLSDAAATIYCVAVRGFM